MEPKAPKIESKTTKGKLEEKAGKPKTTKEQKIIDTIESIKIPEIKVLSDEQINLLSLESATLIKDEVNRIFNNFISQINAIEDLLSGNREKNFLNLQPDQVEIAEKVLASAQNKLREIRELQRKCKGPEGYIVRLGNHIRALEKISK